MIEYEWWQIVVAVPIVWCLAYCTTHLMVWAAAHAWFGVKIKYHEQLYRRMTALDTSEGSTHGP